MQDSETHRVAGDKREVWKSSSPIPCSKKGHLEEVTWSHVKWDFEQVLEWKFHSLSRQIVPLFDFSHTRKFFYI